MKPFSKKLVMSLTLLAALVSSAANEERPADGAQANAGRPGFTPGQIRNNNGQGGAGQAGAATPQTPAQVAPATPAAPAAPAKKVLDRRELEQRVARAVEIFGRDIVLNVLEGYQVRQSVAEGIMNGKRNMGDYDLIQNAQRNQNYANAYQSGSTNGRIDGDRAGITSANNVAYQLADSDISAAVDLAIDHSQQIVFKANPRDVDFNGSNSGVSSPASVESRLTDSRAENAIRNLLPRQFPSELLREVTDMRAIYRGQPVSFPSSFSGSQAYEKWRQNYFNSQMTDARQYLREISDSNIYENAAENERVFRSVFTAMIDRLVEAEFRHNMSRLNGAALRLGEDMYVTEANNFATELGNYDGYNAAFRPASISAFHREMKTGKPYNNAFVSIKDRVMNSSYVTQEKVTITAENNQTELTLGDTFDVNVLSVTNRGMKPGHILIMIPGQGKISTMGQPGAITIQGLKRVNEAQRFSRLGYINDVTQPDETITVTAQVGDKTFSASFRMTFEAMIRKVATTNDERIAQTLAAKAAQYMKAQFDDISGFKDQYANRRPDMLLVRMLNLFGSLNDAQKNQIRRHSQTFRDAFGGKPTKFLNPKRNEWDAAQNMMNEMGLGGELPKEATKPKNSPGDPYNNGYSPG